MRTTIDLPDDLLARLRAMAHDSGRTLSAVVTEMMSRGLEPRRSDITITTGKSGFPMFAATGRPITTDDVRALDDDE